MQGKNQEKSTTSVRQSYEATSGISKRGSFEIREELLTISPALKPLADDIVTPLSPQQLKKFSYEMSQRLDEEIAQTGSQRLQTLRDKLFARNPQAGRWVLIALLAGILILLAAAIFYATLRTGAGTFSVPTVAEAGSYITYLHRQHVVAIFSHLA